MKSANVKEAEDEHNKKMGIGCGTSVISFILMLILPNPYNSILFIVFLVSFIYGCLQHHKTNVVRGNSIRKQLPQGFDHHITLMPHNDGSFSISRHFGNMGTTANPDEKDACMYLNSRTRKILFWNHHKLGNTNYYLTSVNFTPDIQTNITGKAKSRLGSALVGGALFGAVGAAIGAARKRKVILHTNATENEYGTDAYLQLVTADFKHIKQLHITNVKTADYKVLIARYLISDLQLKQLEAKHGLLKNSSNNKDDIDKLESLKKLLDDGTITQKEFDDEKKKVIGD